MSQNHIGKRVADLVAKLQREGHPPGEIAPHLLAAFFANAGTLPALAVRQFLENRSERLAEH